MVGLNQGGIEEASGPGEFQREDGESDRDDEEGGPGKREHCEAAERDDRAGDDERGPVDRAVVAVGLATTSQFLTACGSSGGCWGGEAAHAPAVCVSLGIEGIRAEPSRDLRDWPGVGWAAPWG